MSSIVIGVRVRPFNQRELKFNSINIVSMPPEKPGLVAVKMVRHGKVLPDPPKEFTFDHAFWTHDGEGGIMPDGTPALNKWADQKHVFEELGRPVLRNVLDGFNATLFAYGQTGSGKTYSMMGYPPGDVGLTPRICDELFVSLAEMSAEADEFQLTTECSYLEIYNEEVHDLLAKERSERGLKVRQHPKTGVFVEGLKKVLVTQSNDILSILNDGNNSRSVAATNMNASSSRSHAVVTITVSLTMTKNGVIQGKYAKLVLVDLAGSERASSTGATGGTLVEGANINKSLTTLGMVLSRLADQAEAGGKSLPVPFRDSSLTFLLHDSFGGNSKTAMIANISPADVNCEETLSTLRFAAVTKRVKNKAIVNENPAAKLIRELTEELSSLKEKLSALKTRKPSAGLPSVESDVNLIEGGNDEKELELLIEDSLAAQGSLVVGDEPELIAPWHQPTEAFGVESTADFSKAALLEAAEGGVDIFVDWRKPHLINLCPDSPTLILTIPGGETFVSVTDCSNPTSSVSLVLYKEALCQARIRFSPLINAVTVERLKESDGVPDGNAAVFINGVELDINTSIPLEHGDRLGIGSLIFRVSHTTNIPTAAPYSKVYMCDAHIFLAETYHRQFVTHKWASGLAGIICEVGESGGTVDIDGSPKKGSVPPLSVVVQSDAIDEVNSLEISAVADMRQSENDLVSQFPVTNAELASYAKAFKESKKEGTAQKKEGGHILSTKKASDLFRDDEYDPMLAPLLKTESTLEQLKEWSREGMDEYLAAMKEHETTLKQQQDMISVLRKELEALCKDQTHLNEEGQIGENTVDLADTTESVSKADEESKSVERALAVELKWHQDVKQLRTFKINGPRDEKDLTTWRLYAEGAKGTFPFLSQLQADQERFYEMLASKGEVIDYGSLRYTCNRDQGAVDDSSQPTKEPKMAFCERFGRRGTFLKMKQNKEKWDLRYFIIIDNFLYYAHSCVGTFRCLGALYLKGSTVTYIGSHGGQSFVVLVKLSSPRRAEEPNECSFYFAFANQKDAALWCHWLAVASLPPIPRTMMDRLTKEALQQFESGGILLEANPQFYVVDPLLLGLTDILVTTEGGSALASWKNDETVVNCECCSDKFTFFNRRHHCRSCGGIFCNTCAPKYGKDGARTCLSCQGSVSGANNDNAESIGEVPADEGSA